MYRLVTEDECSDDGGLTPMLVTEAERSDDGGLTPILVTEDEHSDNRVLFSPVAVRN